MTILIACRDAEASEIPASAARLVKNADAGGWTSRTTYARSEELYREELRVIDSVVVRLRRHPLAAVGSWHNGKFTLAYVWSSFSNPRRISARDLSRFIKGETT